LLKRAFPATAVLVILAIVAWPSLSPSVDRLRIAASLPQVDLEGEPDAVVGVIYAGIDRAGRTFDLTADRVLSATAGTTQMNLSEPRIRARLAENRPVTVAARGGLYDPRHRTLQLEGGVRFELDGQYVLDTEHAIVDLDQGTATGPVAVTARGPFGQVQAEGFHIKKGGETVLFDGRSRLSIDSAVGGSRQ
jgi:LPS export ABC transporter protein LptC